MAAAPGGRPSSGSVMAASGPLTARPPTRGLTATTGRRPRASRTPSRARIGSTDTYGLEGPITTTSAASIAGSRPGAGAEEPSQKTRVTRGAPRRPTSQPWKSSTPSSVCRRVGRGVSHIGSTCGPTPSARQRSAVIAVSLSPASSRAVRTRWVPRSRSPRRNQVGPPSRSTMAIDSNVSPARPQPCSGCASPASVYITVSRSGLMATPRCTKSSPVLTTTSRSAGSSTAASPSTSRAPPTPPDRASTLMRRGPARDGAAAPPRPRLPRE